MWTLCAEIVFVRLSDEIDQLIQTQARLALKPVAVPSLIQPDGGRRVRRIQLLPFSLVHLPVKVEELDILAPLLFGLLLADVLPQLLPEKVVGFRLWFFLGAHEDQGGGLLLGVRCLGDDLQEVGLGDFCGIGDPPRGCGLQRDHQQQQPCANGCSHY